MEMSAILKKYGTNLLIVLMLVLSNAVISSADDRWACGTPAPTSDIQLLTPTSQIIIEDADTIWKTSIVYSSDLINTTSNVTPRVLAEYANTCLLYTSPSPRDRQKSRMPSSA